MLPKPNGKDGASKLIRNLYIPPTFVQADGKSFGEMVKSELVTYGDEWKDANLDDGPKWSLQRKTSQRRVCES